MVHVPTGIMVCLHVPSGILARKGKVEPLPSLPFPPLFFTLPFPFLIGVERPLKSIEDLGKRSNSKLPYRSPGRSPAANAFMYI